MIGDGPSVASLRSELAGIAGLDPVALEGEDPRLIEDLDLDSLAMAEALLVVEERFGLKPGRSDFLVRDWRGVTVSELFEELCRTADAG